MCWDWVPEGLRNVEGTEMVGALGADSPDSRLVVQGSVGMSS